MLRLLWLIPFLPFAGFLLNGLLGARYLSRRAVALVACGAVLASFAISAGAVLELHRMAPAPEEAGPGALSRFNQILFEWMPLGRSLDGADLTVPWGYALDPLSAGKILMGTRIRFLIHVYSIGHLEPEARPPVARSFSYLNPVLGVALTLFL